MNTPARRVLARCFGAANVGSVGVVFWIANDVKYRVYHTPGGLDEREVSWTLVVVVCVLMLIELLGVYSVVEPLDRPVWRRSGFAFIVLALWAVPSTIFGSTHADGVMVWHALWVWLLLLVIALATLASLVRSGHRRWPRASKP